MNEIAILGKEPGDLVPTRTLDAAVVFAPGGVDAILEKIAAEVRSVKTDISTPAGRAAVASLAYKVARSKTALDEAGKNLVSDWKTKAAGVDTERRRIREKLDALRDEVRKPLDDWEAVEQTRVEDHEAALLEITGTKVFDNREPSPQEIRDRLAGLDRVVQRQWQEFSARAGLAEAETRGRLTSMLAAAEKREADRLELERLRREQVAREQKDRDERIAAEAAERARLAAERKAAAEAKQAADQADRERRRVEDERAAALARAEKAEADRLASEQRAEEARRKATEAAERDRVAAIDAERQRVAREEADKAAKAAKREADRRHVAKINNEVLAAFREAGLTEDLGKAVVTAIVTGAVPHTRISY